MIGAFLMPKIKE